MPNEDILNNPGLHRPINNLTDLHFFVKNLADASATNQSVTDAQTAADTAQTSADTAQTAADAAQAAVDVVEDRLAFEIDFGLF